MKNRIISALTRFQAIWRGRCARERSIALRKEQEAHQRIKWDTEYTFFQENKHRIGTNTAILFDRGKKIEAIYSCKIQEIRERELECMFMSVFTTITNSESITGEGSKFWRENVQFHGRKGHNTTKI